MWWNRRTDKVLVTADGLARLLRDLHNNNTGLVEFANGVTVQVFAQSGGDFMVYLTRNQVRTLMSLLPGKTLETEYGNG